MRQKKHIIRRAGLSIVKPKIQDMNFNTVDKKKFDKEQLEQLKLGTEHGVDISVYANPEFMALQMEWIRKGLESKIDISFYSNPAFDWFQMEEIYMGLVDSLEVSKYSYPQIPYDRMREIRKGLKQGVDLSPFEKYDSGELRQLRLALKDNIHIVKYMVDGYDAEQLEVIREALTEGIDIDRYLSKDYRGIALNEIVLGLKKNLKVDVYAKTYYTWQQMRELREGLEERLDTDLYCSKYYGASQMHEIRLGLEAGIDVSLYRSLMYTAKDMRRMRRNIIEKMTCGSAIPAIPGQDGYNEYLFDKEKHEDVCFLDDGSVNFDKSFEYSTCKPGDVIAKYHSATEGKNGFSADGEVIKAIKGKEKRLLSGKGAYYNEKSQEYIASKTGWIHLDESEDVLEVREAHKVDSINGVLGKTVINGNLEVTGNIESGTNLEIDGDLIVDGHVEEANIKCSGNIFIRGGINGNDNSFIETEKSLFCMYIENCKVKACKDIYANYILTSDLQAEGKICALGNKGSIIGSNVSAQLGITCKKAGNEAKTSTRLSVSYPEEDKRTESEMYVKKQKASRELEILTKAREGLKKQFSAEERNNRPDFIKLEKAIYTKSLEIEETETKIKVIEEKIKNKINSRINVFEKVYEGVLFTIDKCKYLSDEEMGKTTFKEVNGKMNVTRE